METLESAGDSTPELPRQQRTILEAIVFLVGKGEPPTVREVGALVGLRSPASVLKHLRRLEKAGLISVSGKSRGKRITNVELVEKILGSDTGPLGTGPLGTGTKPVPPSDAGKNQWMPLGAILEGGGLKGLAGLGQRPERADGIPLVGAIAAGHPFESFSEGYAFSEGSESYSGDEFDRNDFQQAYVATDEQQKSESSIGIDPQVFCDSGDVIALKIQGDSMVDAGILDGDYAIIRRQNSVEEGEIAAVIVNGEGTLKRWHVSKLDPHKKMISLHPENEKFEPIEIEEDHGADVLVIGKYVGLVRGDIRFL